MAEETAAGGPIDARPINTAYGRVDVPVSPQRVVTLHEAALDAALAIGIEPVGTVATRGGKSVATYLRKNAEHIAIVGTPREANLERILRLHPDLILASPYTRPELYRRLSRIAPTIVPSHTHTDPFKQDYWRTESRLFAEALGKSPQIEDVLTRLDTRIRHIQVQLGTHVQLPLVLIRWVPQGAVVMSDRLFAGDLMRQLGFPSFPMAHRLVHQPHSSVVGLEYLEQLDKGWIVLATLNGSGKKALSSTVKHPAMQRLEAVRSGHVLQVDGSLWTSAAGPLAAHAILDDIGRQLLSNIEPEISG